MGVIYIGCDLSNQCSNYKIHCGHCNQNWELPSDDREDYEDYSEEEDDDFECDYDCENCNVEGC